VPIALEQAAPVELGQPPQPLDLEQLDRAMQLGEVLLDHRVGQLGQDLGPQRLDRRTQLAHRIHSSNIRSLL
jgi:hypothetical protein